MRDNSLRTPMDAPSSPVQRSNARRGRLIEPFRGTEKSTMRPPGFWARGARIALIVAASAMIWSIIVGLIALLR